MNFQPGGQIGSWIIERVLGEGGMGVVLRVRSGDLRRALKLIKSRDEEHLLRFEREAQVMATVGDVPGVVRIHEIARTPYGPAILMDDIDGESLEDRLRRGPMTFAEASELIASLADALTDVHGRGIRHRDLKPANILLPGDGDRPLISDFGVAHLTDEQLTQTGQAVGTLAWMAPEQLAGVRGEVGPGCDVWALGVIFHQCLTGTLPWDNVSGPALSSRILSGRLSLSGDLSFAARAVIERCLRLDPDARPNAAELAELLRDPPQPGSRFASAGARRLALGALVPLVVFGLITTVVMVRRRDARLHDALMRQTAQVRRLRADSRRLIADQLARALILEGLDAEPRPSSLPEPLERRAALQEEIAGLLDEDLGSPTLKPELERLRAALERASDLTPFDEPSPAGAASRASAVNECLGAGASAQGATVRILLELDAALARSDSDSDSDPDSDLDSDLEGVANRFAKSGGELLDPIERGLEKRLTAEIAVRRLTPVVVERAARLIPEASDKLGTALLRAAARRVMARDPAAGARLVRRLARNREVAVFSAAELPLPVVRALATPGGDGFKDRERPGTYLPWSIELERRGQEPTDIYALSAIEVSLIDQLNLLSLGVVLGRDAVDVPGGIRWLLELFSREGICLNVAGVLARQARNAEPARRFDAALAKDNPALYLALINEEMSDDVYGGAIRRGLGQELDVARAEKLSGLLKHVPTLRTLRADPRLVGAWQAEIERVLAVFEPVIAGEASVETMIRRLEKNLKNPANPQPHRDATLLAKIRLMLFEDHRAPGFAEAMVEVVRLAELGREHLEAAAVSSLSKRMEGRRFGQPRWLIVKVERFFELARLFRLQTEAELGLARLAEGPERRSLFAALAKRLDADLKASAPYLAEESKFHVKNHARIGIQRLKVCLRVVTGSLDEARREANAWRRSFGLEEER